MSNVLAIIQARTGSTRLPGKVLLPLGDSTVLEQVVRRVQAAASVSEVVVATSIARDDLRIVGLCAEHGVRVCCGSENDVLDRYYQTARLFRPDHVVRITADCPLMDPQVIDTVVQAHLAGGYDYTSNTLRETFPDGEDVEVCTFRALETAWQQARLLSEREHVTLYIKHHPEQFALFNVASEQQYADKRWTLDEPADYEFIRDIYAMLYSGNPLFGMRDVLAALDRRPELERLNSHIMRNEGLQKSLAQDRLLDDGGRA